MNICLSEIKETKHNICKGSQNEKRRRVNESEESGEKRLAQQHLKREENVQMNLLNREKRGWQPNLSIKDKKYQMNQQNVERRDC